MRERCATREMIAVAVALSLWCSPWGAAFAAEPAGGAASFPPWKQFEMQPKDEVQFKLPSDGKGAKWTVNGKPAGEGEAFTLKPSSAGKVVVRGTSIDASGATVDRTWEIDVRGAAGASTDGGNESRPPARVARPAPPRVPRRKATEPSDSPTDDAVATAPPATLPVPAAPPPPPPTPARADGTHPDEVKALLDRYSAAYRARDVDALRRLGQVTNDGQAQQMRDYFAKTPDLDVEVKILDVTHEGGKTRVRFTRRDRFKDPTGQEVSKETPPIEKDVVPSADGLKLQAPGE